MLTLASCPLPPPQVDPATNTSKLQTIITNIDIAAANKANVKASLLEPFSNKSVVLQNNAAAVQQIKAKLNDEASKPGPMCAATDACPAAAAGAISLSEVNVLNAEFTLFNFNLEVRGGGRGIQKWGPVGVARSLLVAARGGRAPVAVRGSDARVVAASGPASRPTPRRRTTFVVRDP